MSWIYQIQGSDKRILLEALHHEEENDTNDEIGIPISTLDWIQDKCVVKGFHLSYLFLEHLNAFLFNLSQIYHICMSNRRCMDRNPLLSILIAMKPVPILLLKKMPRLVSLIPIILLFPAIDMTMFRPIHFHF